LLHYVQRKVWKTRRVQATKRRTEYQELRYLASRPRGGVCENEVISPVAIANYLSGILESLLAGSSIPLYWFLVGSSLGAGVLLLLITPLLKYLMHGKG